MTPERHLTRYTYESTSFNGWRLCIRRKGNILCKYFSARRYGSIDAALEAARDMRERVLAAVAAAPEKTAEIFQSFKTEGGVA